MREDTSPKDGTFPFWIANPPYYLVPICHYRLEFAEAVRYAYELLKPDAIAVELPESLNEPVCTAVQRLPELSVILYHSETKDIPNPSRSWVGILMPSKPRVAILLRTPPPSHKTAANGRSPRIFQEAARR